MGLDVIGEGGDRACDGQVGGMVWGMFCSRVFTFILFLLLISWYLYFFFSCGLFIDIWKCGIIHITGAIKFSIDAEVSGKGGREDQKHVIILIIV